MKDRNLSVVYRDDVNDFISFYHQYDLVDRLRPSCVLDVGCGSGKLAMFLRHQGYAVKTLDFNPRLCPDIVGDIRAIPVGDDSFDVVTAFEILEHLPFIYLQKALLELGRVSRRFVVISIPYQTFNLGGLLWVYKFHKPFFWRLWERWWEEYPVLEHGIHYWEMGYKNYSRKRVEEVIGSAHLVIVERVSDCRFPSHYFYVLEKEMC